MPDSGRSAAEALLSERLRRVLDEVPAVVAVLRAPDLAVEYVNARMRALIAGSDPLGRPITDVLAAVVGDEASGRFAAQLRQVLATGETARGAASPVWSPGATGPSYWDHAMIALRAGDEPPAGVVVHAVEVTRLVEQRRRAEEAEHRFDTLFEANAIGVTIAVGDTIVEANDAFLRMIGRNAAELAAGGIARRDVTPPESWEADALALDQLRRSGAAEPYEKEYLRPDGSRVPVLISGSRLRDEPLQVLATAFDLSERKAVEREVASLLERERDARFAAELAGTRASRLQEITARLSATSSAEQIARIVVQHALEELSATAGLLARGSGDLVVIHAGGFDAPVVERWRAAPEALPPLLGRALLAGTPLTTGPRDDLPGAALAVAVPLLAPRGAGTAEAGEPADVPGRKLGALLLTFGDRRELGAEDDEFLASLARQASAALLRAELFEDRAYVARTLQEGLLPQRLAAVPGAEAAVVYESISGRGEVGGDFYDLFDTGLGGWALAVGDVSGKGTGAAVVAGLARHTLRAVARVYDDPDQILEFLNGALRRHEGPPAFCTVACAVIEPHPKDGFIARVSSGGHPYPLVLRSGGGLEQLVVTGTMLGVAEDPQLEQAGLRLGRGDALVLHTDGVTDARAAGGERFGEARLHGALLAARGGSAADLAAAVERSVRAHEAAVPADDRAIVVFRVT